MVHLAAPPSHPDHIEDIPDDEAVTAEMNNLSLKGNEAMPAEDEIPDMEEDDLEDALNSNIVAQPKQTYVATPCSRAVPQLFFSQPEASGSNIQKTRKYDAMITYDKLYQTPRLWLLGYDEVSIIGISFRSLL